MRIENAADERGRDQPVIDGEMRHVSILDDRPRLNHALPVVCGWFEEIHVAMLPIHDPRMLTIDGRIAADETADEELGLDADLDQLPPGPQREVFAVAALTPLERARILPHVGSLNWSRSVAYSHVASQAVTSSMHRAVTLLWPLK